MTDFDANQLALVRKFIENRFSEGELRTLCFDLGLDYDNLPAEGKANAARELVDYCRRHTRLPELLAKLRQERPKAFDEAGLAVLLDADAAASFPDRLIQAASYPLACACAGFNAAQSDKERFEALDRLAINFVKYLMAIALSQYWQDHPDPVRLRAWLAELAEARLVTALNILERIADHYAAAPKNNLDPILFQPYVRPVSDDAPVAQAGLAIARLPGGRAQANPITPRTFLAQLLEFRQLKWEGCPSEVDASIRAALLPKLSVAWKDLMQAFDPLLGYPLHYIERIDRAGSEWVYTMVAFPGARGEPMPVEPFRQAGADEPACRPHRLYLCSPDGRPWLNLHPLFIAHLYRLYFLERGADSGELWYRHCALAERFHPPDYYHLLSGSLSQAPDQAAGEDVVKQIQQAGDELEEAENKTRLGAMALPILLTHFSDEAVQVLQIALGESLRIGQFWLGVEFLLMGLSKQDGGPLPEMLEACEIDAGKVRGALRGLVDVRDKSWRKQRDVQTLGAQALPHVQEVAPDALATLYGTDKMPQAAITPRMMAVLRQAVRLAGGGTSSGGKAEPAHLLLAALQQPHCVAVNVLLGQIAESGHDPRDVLAQLEHYAPAQSPEQPRAPVVQPPAQERPLAPKGKGMLGQVGRDLTALAQAEQLREAIGNSAHKAMVQMGLILQQTQANNPILLGDPGVGKTAIVEGFAWRLAVGAQHGKKPVAPQLADKRIVDLPPAALLAGTKYRGELEERLQKLLAEVKAAGRQTIVFIDEIHTILGGKAEGGLGSIAEMLKPALARGEFPCIGATTVGEYRRYIEADPALARRFTPVWIEEPSVDEAFEIVKAVAQQYLGPSHNVQYPDDVVREAIQLAVRYIHDEFLPGKAIKLLDQAGPRVVMGGSLSGLSPSPLAPLPGGEGKSVTVEIVRAIVSERTGVPLTRLSEDEGKRLLQLEARLKERVKGQEEAVAHVARVVKRARAGLADPRRPLGVFLFAGPTGVGKTELALALAEALFDEQDAIVRLDMSEYMEKHQVSRLIGSPPGYVGYEEEGQLTGRLRRRPYSVVLLDEIEKAHEDVQHLFLQLFDAGRLTDSRGNLADGRNAIFIMTTNLGAKVPLGFTPPQMPSFASQMKGAIEEHFTPEFLNRVDRIVYFAPLGEDTLLTIFDKQFKAVAAQLREKGIEVEVSDGFKRVLCKRHTDATRGARPLQRAIEDEIIAPLTDKLLAGEVKPGMKIVVSEGKMEQVALSGPVAPPGAGDRQPVADAGQPEQAQPSPVDKPPSPQMPPPLAGRPGLQEPGEADLGMDPREAHNRALVAPLLEKLMGQLRGQGIEIILTDGAWELVCSPFWTGERKGLESDAAFVQLVEQPLMQKVQAGEFQPGDRVEARRGLGLEIEFKKLEGEAQ